MAVRNIEALKNLDEGFIESKRKQLQSFLDDQRELNVRLRKCSFDAKASPNNSDRGKAHRLRPLSARPSTAQAPPQASETVYHDGKNLERKSSRLSSKSRRPSTACGFRSMSEEFYSSEEESVFDALSITSLQSGTPSIGELGDIDELDETPIAEDEPQTTSIKRDPMLPKHLSQSGVSYTAKPVQTDIEGDNSPQSNGLSANPTSCDEERPPAYSQERKAKTKSKSRRKSASCVKYLQLGSFRSPDAASIVESKDNISGIATVECPASLYRKIRHHSAPATRNDEIVARMNQQSKRPIGLVRLPPLNSEKTTNPGPRSSTELSLLPKSQADFMRTQPLLKAESIL